MKVIRFIYEYLKRSRTVGTVIPSTKYLGQAMAEDIKGKHVIEIGAGTGPMTTKILEHLPKDGRLTCLEINPVFCEVLRKITDERLTVINDDAENLEAHLDESQCIVSSLPLASIDIAKRKAILKISSQVNTYIQLQYTPFLKKQLKTHFSHIRTKFVWRNFALALVYVCSNNPTTPPKT